MFVHHTLKKVLVGIFVLLVVIISVFFVHDSLSIVFLPNITSEKATGIGRMESPILPADPTKLVMAAVTDHMIATIGLLDWNLALGARASVVLEPNLLREFVKVRITVFSVDLANLIANAPLPFRQSLTRERPVDSLPTLEAKPMRLLWLLKAATVGVI
jgi:hypothetical protein